MDKKNNTDNQNDSLNNQNLDQKKENTQKEIDGILEANKAFIKKSSSSSSTPIKNNEKQDPKSSSIDKMEKNDFKTEQSVSDNKQDIPSDISNQVRTENLFKAQQAESNRMPSSVSSQSSIPSADRKQTFKPNDSEQTIEPDGTGQAVESDDSKQISKPDNSKQDQDFYKAKEEALPSFYASKVAADSKVPTFKKSFFRSKRTILFVALIIILIGSVSAAYVIVSKQRQEERLEQEKILNSPEKILSDMRANSKQVKSFKYDIKISVKIDQMKRFKELSTIQPKQSKNNFLNSFLSAISVFSSSESQSQTIDNDDVSEDLIFFDVGASGASDLNDLSNPRQELNLDITGNEGTEEKLVANTNLRFLNKKVFLKLNELSIEELASTEKSQIERFKNQWFYVDSEEIKNEIKELGASEEEFSEYSGLTEEQQITIKNLYNESKFFELGEKLGEETINGVETLHFKTNINKNNSRNFFIELFKIIIEQQTMDEKTKKEIFESIEDGEISDFLDQLLDNIEIIESEIWIGKENRLAYKVYYKLIINLEEAFNFSYYELSERSGRQTGAEIDFKIDYSEYNKPISILEPEDSKSFIQSIKNEQEMWSLCTGQSIYKSPSYIYDSDFAINDSQIKIRDFRRRGDLSIISITLRHYFEKKGAFPIFTKPVHLNDSKNKFVTELSNINREYFKESLPKDPLDPEFYYGFSSSDGHSYILTARMEGLKQEKCDSDVKDICLFKFENDLKPILPPECSQYLTIVSKGAPWYSLVGLVSLK